MHDMIYIPYKHWWISEQDLQLNHFCLVSSLKFKSHKKDFHIHISKEVIDDMILSSCFPCLSELTQPVSLKEIVSDLTHPVLWISHKEL